MRGQSRQGSRNLGITTSTARKYRYEATGEA